MMVGQVSDLMQFRNSQHKSLAPLCPWEGDQLGRTLLVHLDIFGSYLVTGSYSCSCKRTFQDRFAIRKTTDWFASESGLTLGTINRKEVNLPGQSSPPLGRDNPSSPGSKNSIIGILPDQCYSCRQYGRPIGERASFTNGQGVPTTKRLMDPTEQTETARYLHRHFPRWIGNVQTFLSSCKVTKNCRKIQTLPSSGSAS